MLTEVKKHFKLLAICFKYNLLKAMDNRVSFISQVFGMILNNGIMIVQWIVLFSLKDNIGGYGFREVLLLWGIAAASYGVAHTMFFNVFSLSRLIVGGKLDAFLVQPKDTLVYVASSSMSVSAIGDILYGIIILIVLQASIITWLLFILFAITGGLILVSFAIIVHSLSFWFNNAEDVADVANATMVNMGTYPNGIFSEKVRWIFLTIIPISMVVHLPITVMTNFNLPIMLTVVFFTLFIVILSFIIFNKGLKRYSSSNLMSARI